jgi:hypothetical protein
MCAKSTPPERRQCWRVAYASTAIPYASTCNS